jgi:CRISPR system Cascade subunit CasA
MEQSRRSRMTRRFNLFDEPWVPCRERGQDRTRDRPLLDVLLNCHAIESVEHPSPIVTIALHRLLVATVYSALRGPSSLSDLQTILEYGRLDRDKIHAYANRWKARFWLFSDSHPFLQDSRLSGDLLPIYQLLREAAAPSAHTLFDHTLPDGRGIRPAEAVRYLIADQFFALQDGRGYTPSPLSFGLATMVVGRSLFETLALNLLPYNEERPVKALSLESDAPIWEQESPQPHPFPLGWLDYLTRPYRRLLLVPPQADVVTHLYRSSATALDGEWRAANRDPWVAYRVTDDGLKSVGLRKEKALWRDSHAIVQHLVRRHHGEPGYVRLLARLGRVVPIQVTGVMADNNRVDMWRQERMDLALPYMRDERLLAVLGGDIDAAEKAARILHGLIRELAKYVFIPNWDELPSDVRDKRWAALNKRPSPSKASRVEEFIGALAPERAYWPALDVPFRRFMRDLPDDAEQDPEARATRTEWARAIRDSAQDAFERVARAVETSGRGYRAAAAARSRFQGQLAGALAGLVTAANDQTAEEAKP